MDHNKLTYKTSALLLAALLFISSTGFSFNVHICQNEVQSISFFGEAPVCEMAKKNQQIESEKSCCAKKKERERLEKLKGKVVISAIPCCNNQQVFYDSDSEFKTSQELNHSVEHHNVFAISNSHFQTFLSNENVIPTCLANPPPLIDKNLSVLYQVFRL